MYIPPFFDAASRWFIFTVSLAHTVLYQVNEYDVKRRGGNRLYPDEQALPPL
jgi:hypothetical protein